MASSTTATLAIAIVTTIILLCYSMLSMLNYNMSSHAVLSCTLLYYNANIIKPMYPLGALQGE